MEEREQTDHPFRRNLPILLDIPEAERAKNISRIAQEISLRNSYSGDERVKRTDLMVDVIACASPRYVFSRNEKENLSFWQMDTSVPVVLRPCILTLVRQVNGE